MKKISAEQKKHREALQDQGHSYDTRCPYCKKEDKLDVVLGTFAAFGMELRQDGFSFSDANQMDTSEELVKCDACKKEFSLAEVTL
jgi:hypothetical protein